MTETIHEVHRLDLSVSEVFDLYRWDTGQRIFVFLEIERRAREKSVEPIVSAITRALVHDRAVVILEQKWAGQNRNAIWGPRMKKADTEMNDAIIDLKTMLTLLERKAEEGSPLQESVNHVLKRMFPKGVGDIVNDSYTGKLGKLIAIEDVVADSPWLRQYRVRVELDDFADRFKVFREEMRTREWGMSYETIRNAQKKGHHNLCTLAGLIVGLFPEEEDDRVLREYLLTPIVDQNESVRRALKGRTKSNSQADNNGSNTDNGNANGGNVTNDNAHGNNGANGNGANNGGNAANGNNGGGVNNGGNAANNGGNAANNGGNAANNGGNAANANNSNGTNNGNNGGNAANNGGNEANANNGGGTNNGGNAANGNSGGNSANGNNGGNVTNGNNGGNATNGASGSPAHGENVTSGGNGNHGNQSSGNASNGGHASPDGNVAHGNMSHGSPNDGSNANDDGASRTATPNAAVSQGTKVAEAAHTKAEIAEAKAEVAEAKAEVAHAKAEVAEAKADALQHQKDKTDAA